jgi:hypothetical protein
MSDITKRVDELPLEAQVIALSKALEHVVALSKALEKQRKINRLDRGYYSCQRKMLQVAWEGLVENGHKDYNKDLEEWMTPPSDIEGESNE